MSTVAEKLAARRAQFSGGDKENTQRDFSNNYYPFWNMKPGQRAIIRFLPDLNTSNPTGFLVEKLSHNLTINGQKKTVPCLHMYGEECPICKVSSAYYKAKDEVNGKKYWRKKQHLAQALIIEDPLEPDAETGETHAGKVRNIALGYQLYNIIKEAFASQDDPMDDVPESMTGGYDFIIKKTQQGEYGTYTMGTKFQSKQRPLTEAEIAVAEDGMIDISTLLPKNPGVEKVQAMLDADLNGEDYTDDAKPQRAAPPAPRASSRVQHDDDEPPFDVNPPAPAPRATPPAPAPAGDGDVDAMLAAIRARRKAG